MELRSPNRKLRSLLHAHRLWVSGSLGVRALDVRGVDLSWMDLSGRDMRGANLSRCNLEGTNLSGCKLMGCNFSGANLHRAIIDGADMSYAVLRRAFAAYVRFHRVNLTGVDFEGCDFAGADLSRALFGDDPTSLYFLSKFCIVPEGEMYGWKRLRDGKIAKLLIPAEVKRSSGFTRKCRAQSALVLGIVNRDGSPDEVGISKRDPTLEYTVGETVTADGWDDDWKNECAAGINFFITAEEARAYP